MTSFHFLVEPAEPPLSKHRSASLPDGCPRPFRSRTRPATMSRNAALVLFIAFGTVFQLSCGTQVNVTKDNKLCLFANLTLHFSVSYEVIGNKTETAAFELPENVTSDGSSCDTAESTLKLNFGDGHSLSASFIASEGSYEVESLTFSYNLNDSTLFNNSASEDTMTTKVDLQATKVALNTCYSCHSEQMIRTDLVNMTMWNVLVQAFISDGVKSENITSCAADTPVTPAPTSAPTPSTNTTTVPVTNATSTAPPTTASPPLPDPKTGNYSVTPVNQTDACLLANFGLRLGFKQGDKYQVMNFDPTGANVSGLCGVNSSELTLESSSVTLTMTFTTDTKKFRLHTLNVIVKTSSGAAFSGGNATLSLWEAALGSSYMCNKEQNVTISEELTLLTVDVRVQPFGVKKGLFSTAHECSVDDASILVPIIVGAALAGLILIVVIAYVIGRRKTYVGYQTL